jgi:UDP-glucose 4-epimerase
VPSTSNVDIITDINNSLIDSINIFKCAVNSNVKKIVYFSSGGAIYSPQNRPIKETDLQNPITSYGIIKTTTEKYLELFKKNHQIDVLIIRPSNPYGPRQGNYNRQGVISTFIKNTILGESLTVYGDGRSAKDYIYVEDLAKITFSLVENNINGTFNVGSGVVTSLNTIIEIINNINDNKSEVKYTNQSEYDIPNFALNIDKLGEYLKDPISFTSIVDGINITWNWIIQNTGNNKL